MHESRANLSLSCTEVLGLPLRCHMTLNKSLTLCALQFAFRENEGPYTNTTVLWEQKTQAAQSPGEDLL